MIFFLILRLMQVLQVLQGTWESKIMTSSPPLTVDTPPPPKAPHAPQVDIVTAPPQTPVQVVPEEQEPEQEPEPDPQSQLPAELRDRKWKVPVIAEEEGVEELDGLPYATLLRNYQHELTETFETFKDRNAQPVVNSLKKAEAPVDAARDTFAQCAKQFVGIMSQFQDASDRKHDKAKVEMHRTYIEAIESTNTGADHASLLQG